MNFLGKNNFRDKLIAGFTLAGGVYFFLFFILPESYLEAWRIKQHHEDISLGFISIGLLAFGLGIINLFMIHGGKIIYLKKGWGQSLALIGGMLVMMLFSCLDWRQDYLVQKGSADLNLLYEFSKAIQADIALQKSLESGAEGKSEKDPEWQALVAYRQKKIPEAPIRISILRKELEKLSASDETLAKSMALRSALPDTYESLPALSQDIAEALSVRKENLRKNAEESFAKRGYKFLFEGLFVSLGSALFSLLGVYIAAAAYRAFRIKTWESSLMMLAALIVMLGQISYGTLIYHDMPLIRGWLLEVPNSAVSRAISIGASVAGLVLAIRMWFSIESDSFSSKKD